MRFIILPLLLAITLSMAQTGWALDDYNDRFVKNFPPGFHGMWYKAERFYKRLDPEAIFNERYRWDRFMSRNMNTFFPYYPIPYDWEYGSTRNFNLPDYNTNDWY